MIFQRGDVYIDFNRMEWYYTRYWMNPSYDAKTLISIYFNNTLKENRIKRMLNKIESNKFKVKKAIEQGKNQIEHLQYIIRSIKFNYRNINQDTDFKRKIEDIFVTISLEIEYYDNYLRQLVNYNDLLPKLEHKYLAKIKVLRNKDICSHCFSENSSQNLIEIKRCKKLCVECNTKDKELIDCPVCLDEFKKINMVEIKCGNNHFTCKKCYSNMKKLSNSCPICRGNL